jgi:hypothetical protein
VLQHDTQSPLHVQRLLLELLGIFFCPVM